MYDQVPGAGRASRRGFLRAAALLLGGVALSACAPASPPAATAAAAKPTAAPVPPVATAPASGATSQPKLDLGGYTGPPLTAQAITLRLTRQFFPPAAVQWWKDRYAEWATAYPNITIREEEVPYGDLNPKLQTYVAAGDPPDIMMGKGDFVRAYVFNNVAVNLSEFLNDDFLNDLAPAIKSQQMVDGKLYSWPWDQGHVLLWFNKDLFAKAGVTPPPETTDVNAGWTWDQALAAWQKVGEALNKGGEVTTWPLAAEAYGNGGPGSSYWYSGTYVRGMGDPKAAHDSSAYRTFAGVSDTGLTATGYVNTPESIKGLSIYQSLYQKKLTPSVAVDNQFDDGKAATHFDTCSLGGRLVSSKAPFQFGASPVPKGNILFNHTSGDSPIVLKKSKYIPEAVAFMSFLTNDKNAVSWRHAWGNMPARTSLYAKVGYTDPWDLLGVEMTKAGYAPPSTPGYLEYFSAMNAAVKDIALGANVADRLQRVAGEIDRSLANYKK